MNTLQTYDYANLSNKNVRERYIEEHIDVPHIEAYTDGMSYRVALEQQNMEPLPKTVVVMIFIFIVLWIVAGIAAFIMSIMCFGYSGTTVQHVVGFLLALFFGPFYWIYYFYVKSYCGVQKQVRRTRR